MDVTQVLRSAWEAVAAANLPEHVQGLAFEQAVRLLTGANTDGQNQEARTNGEDQRPDIADSTSTASTSEEDYFEKFSAESGIPSDRLQNVFKYDGQSVQIIATRRRLGGDSEAECNRNVALLLTGARWYAEGEVSTKLADIREAAKKTGYEPSRNLSSHLESVPGTQTAGLKSEKAVRVQRGRFDEPFRELVERLAD